ncbi:hypothetical protein [Actinoplanes derwentensis]|uniref:N-acetyltransferase domain-containing protein n=1 Tax=Actinoplanes derwentensis TaxID=113562 RepID=A0A1H1PXX6_9ACTN|nr:hypothetical protein [Actinoplanes derwentensis]GID82296.1 hypothetical protein Ade03nite_12200 [Actinoplanes derwentensis]SDS16065.1 hypothetical protein SAMN04489716_0149 [Actinoplanes derwentensis]
MRVEVMPELPADLLDESWEFYLHCFNDLRVLAANRHLLYREEFDDLMSDERVPKYVALDADGGVIGLAAMTTDLDAISLISPEYFEYHWPELFRENRIFYVSFVGADRGTRGSGVFIALLRRMYQPIGEVDGKVVVDICSYNEDRHSLPRMISIILGRAAGRAQPTRVDAQSFWLYEFPKAGLPVRREERRGLQRDRRVSGSTERRRV